MAAQCRHRKLTATARAATVVALIAGSVPGHDAAAFRTQRGIACADIERQRLLRLRFCGTKPGRITGLIHFRNSEEARAQPPEDVIDD